MRHPHEFPQDLAQSDSLKHRMAKRCVEVDGVVMPATVLADVEHARSTQIADDTPHRAACQEESFGEVVYSAVLVCCDTEQHGAVAGDVVPAVIGTGRELRLPHSRTLPMVHGLIIVKYARESSPQIVRLGRAGVNGARRAA